MLPGMLRLVCCVCVRMPSLALLAEKLVSLLALLCLLALQKQYHHARLERGTSGAWLK